MKIIVCLGCGKEVERTGNSQKYCRSCRRAEDLKKDAEYRARPEVKMATAKRNAERYAKPEVKAAIAKWSALHYAKPEIKAARRKWHQKWYAEQITKPEFRAALAKKSKKWNEENKEHASVRSHHYNIFKSTDPKLRTYKGMPFFDAWNPDKGGSFKAGGDWIIANLGKRPEGKVSLDVIHHEIGFVPGNLRWSERKGQNSNQMHKIIAQLKHENNRLKLLIAENPLTAKLAA